MLKATLTIVGVFICVFLSWPADYWSSIYPERAWTVSIPYIAGTLILLIYLLSVKKQGKSVGGVIVGWVIFSFVYMTATIMIADSSWQRMYTAQLLFKKVPNWNVSHQWSEAEIEEKLFPILDKLSQSDDVYERRASLRAIKHVKDKSDPLIPILKRHLEDDNEVVLYMAISVTGDIGKKAVPLIPLLENLTKDPRQFIKTNANRVIDELKQQ